MRPEFARQRQQRQRLFERQVGRRHVAQQRLTLGLFLALGLAELDVETIRSLAQRDLLARDRIDTEILGPSRFSPLVASAVGIDDAEFAREAALGIVRESR